MLKELGITKDVDGTFDVIYRGISKSQAASIFFAAYGDHKPKDAPEVLKPTKKEKRGKHSRATHTIACTRCQQPFSTKWNTKPGKDRFCQSCQDIRYHERYVAGHAPATV